MLNACRVEPSLQGEDSSRNFQEYCAENRYFIFRQIKTLCVILAFSKGGKEGKKRHISACSLSFSISQYGSGPAPEFPRIAARRGETFAAALTRRRQRYLIELSAPEHPP